MKTSASLSGFTLIETLVAITILTIAIVGPFHAVQSALSVSYTARDQLIAASLAQEAIEYVRSIRDNNYLNGRAWMDGLSSLACYDDSDPDYCTVDPTLGDPHDDSDAVEQYFSLASIPTLSLSSANLYNQQGSGTETRFTRSIRVYELSSTEVRIEATVTWITLGTTYNVFLQESLHQWL